jgi:LPS export ABC transporter protein LptC
MSVALGIFIALAFFILNNHREMLGKVLLQLGENFLSGITFKTTDRRGNKISVKSDGIYEEEKGLYVLKNAVSTFTLSNGELLTISADLARALQTDPTKCEFRGSVRLSTQSGLKIMTEHLFIDFNEKIARGESRVDISTKDAKVSAMEYFFDLKNNKLTLINEANGSFKFGHICANRLIINFDDIQKKNLKSIEAVGNPIYKFENYTLKASGSIRYSNDVIAVHSSVVLNHWGKTEYLVQADSMRAMVINGKVNTVAASGSLIIKTKDVIIHADKGLLKDNLVNVVGKVAISGRQGNIFGKSASLDLDTQEVDVRQSSGVVVDSVGWK